MASSFDSPASEPFGEAVLLSVSETGVDVKLSFPEKCKCEHRFISGFQSSWPLGDHPSVSSVAVMTRPGPITCHDSF